MASSTIKCIHVVINPASGQPQPVLHTLNSIFHSAGIEWDVSITAASGDASRFANEAVARGVDLVAAYGGDGTQMEVAQGLRGSNVPMVILPGGTANLHQLSTAIERRSRVAVEVVQPLERISVDKEVDRAMLEQRAAQLAVSLGLAMRKSKEKRI